MKIFNNCVNRWVRAQKKEKEFVMRHGRWQVITKGNELSEENRQILLKQLLNVTRSTVDYLKSNTLLEIGGIYYANIAAETIPGIKAIALDPLIDFHLDGYQDNSDRCRYICCMAEKMQINDSSIDICICRNAIDHMQSPDIALQEIKRVLKKNGKLHISCNVFHGWSRPLFPLFDLFDFPHPHHYTKSSFLNLLTKNKYQIDFSFPETKTNVRSFKANIGKIFGFRNLAFYCSINK